MTNLQLSAFGDASVPERCNLPPVAQNYRNPKPRVSKPILTESKSVFAPRGTAAHTPKWSIVVLAVACLGVLKFNGPGAKTSAARETPPGETAAAALLLPPVQNKLQTNPPPTDASGGHEKDQIVTVRVKGALAPGGKHVGFRAVGIDDEKSKNQ